jgi:hypothetical protein
MFYLAWLAIVFGVFNCSFTLVLLAIAPSPIVAFGFVQVLFGLRLVLRSESISWHFEFDI